MTVSAGVIVIGTRGSALARWQAAEVGRLLREAHPGLEVRENIVVTQGDLLDGGAVRHVFIDGRPVELSTPTTAPTAGRGRGGR